MTNHGGKYTKPCPYCGTMLNADGEEPENVGDFGPPIEHTVYACRERMPRVGSIEARIKRRETFDWTPSEEDSNFPVWVMDEIKREHRGRYADHPPYTDTGIELLDSIGLWPWQPVTHDDLTELLRLCNYGTGAFSKEVLDSVLKRLVALPRR